jgi:hypothetical protein
VRLNGRCRDNTTVRSGSRCVNSLFKLIAGKRPLELRFPEAASRQRVLPTCCHHSGRRVDNGRSAVPSGHLFRIMFNTCQTLEQAGLRPAETLTGGGSLSSLQCGIR